MRDCARCQRLLASLTETVHALGSISADAPADLSDSIIAALGAERPADEATPHRSQHSPHLAALTVVHGSAQDPLSGRVRRRLWVDARVALSYCLSRSQLRITLPIAVLAGVVLSLVNMGGTLVHGRIDLGVCIMCATNFVVPFAALNLALVILLRARGRGRARGRHGRAA